MYSSNDTIYNMLMDYKGNMTAKIDGLGASAASMITIANRNTEYVSSYGDDDS